MIYIKSEQRLWMQSRTLEYVSAGGYQYKQSSARDGRIVRVAKTMVAVTHDPPKVGDMVTVIVKPYNARTYVSGRVKLVLTKKKMHTRGFKVMLVSGVVGRVVAAAR